MAVQLKIATRNSRLDAIETEIGTSPILKVRTGAQPADCATADAGTVLATMTLPSDWMAAASAGAKALLGTWQDTSADATGTAGHFRIYDSGGAVCHIQGSCGQGSGDLSFDNSAIVAGQTVNVTAFTLTDGNA